MPSLGSSGRTSTDVLMNPSFSAPVCISTALAQASFLHLLPLVLLSNPVFILHQESRVFKHVLIVVTHLHKIYQLLPTAFRKKSNSFPQLSEAVQDRPIPGVLALPATAPDHAPTVMVLCCSRTFTCCSLLSGTRSNFYLSFKA